MIYIYISVTYPVCSLSCETWAGASGFPSPWLITWWLPARWLYNYQSINPSIYLFIFLSIYPSIYLSISSDLIWSIHMSMSTYGRRMIATSQLPPALESREIFLRREPGFEHPNRPKWTDVFVKLCKYIPIFSLIFVHGMIVGMKFEVQFAWDLLRFKMNHPRWNDCHFQVATSRAQPPLCSNALTNTRNLTYFRRKR